MKTSKVLAVVLLLAGVAAPATTRDDSKTYVATVDPPAGSMRCGFTVAGNIKSPKDGYLKYGLFWRSELNIDSPFNQRNPVGIVHFTGPGTIRVTAASKDVGDDAVFQKHKTIQVKLKVWWADADVLNGSPVPVAAPMVESVWVDVPMTSPGCGSTKPMTGLSPSHPTTTVQH